MSDGDYVAKNLNVFNTIVAQLVLVKVKMDETDHFMTLLCYFLDSWDNLVMPIGSTVKCL